jgi:hypothetical protein
MSCGSTVGIESRYGLDDRGVGVPVPVGSKTFTSPYRPDRLWGPTQPPIQWVPVVISLGVKRSGYEADHLPPAIAGVKKTWIYTFTPLIRLHGVVLNWLSSGTALPLLTLRITPWPESASELYRPSDRRLSAKLVPTFAGTGCHVISVTDL